MMTICGAKVVRFFKWSLIISNLSTMSASILLAAMSDEFALMFATEYGTKTSMRSAIIIIAIINELFGLLGLMGAYRRHLWTTATVAVYMSFIAVWAVLIASRPAFGELWFFALFNGLNAAIGYLFAILLAIEKFRPCVESVTEFNNPVCMDTRVTGDEPPVYEPPPLYSEYVKNVEPKVN